MDVEVLQRKRQSRPGARFSLLGDGLLERTRSTMLALLGLTAAVGLALIAIVMQGDWPLIAGSPVPRAPVVHESVGDATALGAEVSGGTARQGPASRPRTAAARSGQAQATTEPSAASAPAAPDELVSSPAAPVASHGGGSHGGHAPQDQTPAASQPQQTTATAPNAEPSSPATTPASPPPTEAPAPEATASEAPPPVESNVPFWSPGQGHAYGRDDGKEHGPCHDSQGRAGD
jgi:hypothetical protein